MINILIVDDHHIMRKGLITVLAEENDFKIVGEAGDGEEAIAMAQTLKPDVILMDIKMPKMDGISAAAEIKQRQPHIKVIILTAIEDEEEIFEAIENGIDGYLLKNASADELVHALRVVNEDEKFLDPIITRKVMDTISQPTDDLMKVSRLSLTERELKVLKLMAQGYKNREIAGKLYLGEETVKSHVSNILSKLGQTDRIQAVFYALRIGLIKLDD